MKDQFSPACCRVNVFCEAFETDFTGIKLRNCFNEMFERSA